MKLRMFFAWYDAWVGFYWDAKRRVLYVCLVPCVVLAVECRAQQSAELGASANSRRNAISKKDARYARSMHRLEDEQDALDARDFGEAYNFHMDCGDR